MEMFHKIISMSFDCEYTNETLGYNITFDTNLQINMTVTVVDSTISTLSLEFSTIFPEINKYRVLMRSTNGTNNTWVSIQNDYTASNLLVPDLNPDTEVSLSTFMIFLPF